MKYHPNHRFSLIRSLYCLLLAALCFVPRLSFADYPRAWQLYFQEPATPVMEKVLSFHNLLLVIITAITIFVLVLLGYVCWRYRAKANPVPSKTSHHTVLEIIWTTVPVLILVCIVVPSLKLLYFAEKDIKPEMTIKVTGYQWYWGYEYPDQGNIAFESVIKKDTDLKPGELRLLTVDNPIVLPVNTKIRVLVTGADVIHSWAVPSFGVKTDAVPGRVNETWIEIERPGTYYGQCSELCGVNHGFMPIMVKAVSKEEFQQWIEDKKAKSANNNRSAAS